MLRFRSKNATRYDNFDKGSNYTILVLGILLFVSGIILEVILYYGSIDHTTVRLLMRITGTATFSIGASLVASFVYFLLTVRKLFRSREIEQKVVGEWGIIKKFTYRREIYSDAETTLRMKNSMDLCTLTAKTLRDTVINHEKLKDIIEEKVSNGLIVRIITVKPDSSFLETRIPGPDTNKDTLKTDIESLGKWVATLQVKAGRDKKDHVSIQYHDSLPLDFYFRADEYLFVGQYLQGLDSEQTPTLMYQENTKGYGFYTGLFDAIWKEKEVELRKTEAILSEATEK